MAVDQAPLAERIVALRSQQEKASGFTIPPVLFHDGSHLGAFDYEISLYGGSYNTYRPSFELAGASGKLTYFFTGDFLTSGIGIESPDGKDYPIHDHTEQYRGFGYGSYVIDKTSRLSWLPWDLDLSMAGFFFCGTPAQRIEFSIDQPSSIKDRLIRRIFEVPEFREKYHGLMREFLAGFKKERVFAQIDAFF